MRKRNFDSRRRKSKSWQCGGEEEEIESGPGLHMACYWLQGLDTRWLAFAQKLKNEKVMRLYNETMIWVT